MCREPLRFWLFGVASYSLLQPLHRFQGSYLSSLLMVELLPRTRVAQTQTLASEKLGLVGVRVLLVGADVLRVGNRFLPSCPRSARATHSLHSSNED